MKGTKGKRGTRTINKGKEKRAKQMIITVRVCVLEEEKKKRSRRYDEGRRRVKREGRKGK